MTTIVCNKDEIACDLQFTEPNSGDKWKGKTKVFYFEPHDLHYPKAPFYIGFAGTARDMITIADYFSLPEEHEELPKIEPGSWGLVLTATREIFLFDHFSSWLAVNEPYASIGSGSSVAKGAMAAGKSPVEAVRIAMKHDAYTGFGVKSFNFK